MNQLITVTGMVLSASPVGEYDRRVVLLTKERGKISAFAKGSRRPQSQLAGVTMPCCFGVFSIYEGRTSYTIHSAEISRYFEELRTDVQAAYYAFYFLEFADYYTHEGSDEQEMLLLLYRSVRALTRRLLPLRLIRYIYELRAVSAGGEGPQVFRCVICGKEEGPFVFSVRRGGLVCEDCRREVTDGMELHTSTLYALQYVLSAPPEKLYSFRLSDEVLEEFGRVVERYVEVYVGHRFQSLEILGEIAGLAD